MVQKADQVDLRFQQEKGKSAGCAGLALLVLQLRKDSQQLVTPAQESGLANHVWTLAELTGGAFPW